MLWLEECQMLWDLKQYDLHDITLELDKMRLYTSDASQNRRAC